MDCNHLKSRAEKAEEEVTSYVNQVKSLEAEVDGLKKESFTKDETIKVVEGKIREPEGLVKQKDNIISEVPIKATEA